MPGPPRTSIALLVVLVAGAATVAACGDAPVPAPPQKTPPPPVDIEAFLTAPTSCAYVCPLADDCAEKTSPYVCPALGAWDAIPHVAECPAWDGTYPAVTTGACKATAPTGDALRRPGSGSGSSFLLPDGRDTTPAGAGWIFAEAELGGGMTQTVVAVPGTPYALTVDTGQRTHSVRSIDTTLLGTGDPVVGVVAFDEPELLNGSLAFVAPSRVWVATAFGVVQAITLDPATGALVREDDASLALPASQDANGAPAPWFTAAVAASPDGKRLVATAVEEEIALVYDIDPASPTYKSKLGQVSLGDSQTFGVWFDPADTVGSHAYVSLWGGKKVVDLDLADPTAPKVARSFPTDQNPQGVAFFDERWMVVANDFGETISVVDRVDGSVTSVPVELEPGLRGLDVSSLAYDAQAKRLYATLAGVNALAVYDVDLGGAAPVLTPVGRLPTAWWPSAVAILAGGDLAVTTVRGRGIGPLLDWFAIGDGDGDAHQRGSIHRIPAPSAADLAAGDAAVRATVEVGARTGYPSVDCPGGASDFPVPATNTEGPSKTIEHVFFVVRENKSFDALFGDLPGVDGDPEYAMKKSSADMERVWPNLRTLAKEFTVADNFYNLAVQSTQGHTWTTYGRANDFDERTWADEARLVPLSGVGEIGRPEEGSLFDLLQAGSVRYDLLGEIVGQPAGLPDDYNPIDLRYPGGPFQNITYNDLEKACYTAARMRVGCDLGSFVYMTLPNDHTIGASPENPTPEVMCAVNDEATGMFVDALSHSPLWASSLVVVTEDDPQQGGDHVDYHRTPLVLISPWVKRGYVTSTHIDVPSLHKLFAHILGLPYPNVIVKNAGLALDAFTSTPDFTPYDYQRRVWPLECGNAATKSEQKLTESWDFLQVDEQPGLGAQVMRWMRGRQLTELPPALRREIDARNARKAAGLPPLDDDD